jgi:hypothetical protein
VPGSDAPSSATSPSPLEHIEVVPRTWTCAGRNRCTFVKILQLFIVVVVQTVHRDAPAVALQFAAHVETGPRKQELSLSSIEFQRVGLDNTPPFREDAGVPGERRGQKSKPSMQVPSKGEEFWAFAFYQVWEVVTMLGLVAFILGLIAVIYVPPGASLLHSVRIPAF